MRIPSLALASAMTLGAVPALAEPPVVVADIAPVHSLVAQVMEGVGTPALLLPGGEPVHEAGLSPSRAAALEGADLIIWTGGAMLPWLADALPSLAPDAASLALLDTADWAPLTVRDTLTGEAGHGHDEAHEDGTHEDEAHEDGAHDEVGHAHGEPGSLDPHAWLDPSVAAAWVGMIGETLAEADPDNAAAYRANAGQARAAILAKGEAIAARLAPVAARPYVVGHDASQYFERATGLAPRWSLASVHGGTPPASVVQAVSAALAAGEATCIMADAETSPALLDSLIQGTDARVVTADPEGVTLEAGPGLYAALMEGMAQAAEACLAP